MDAPRRIGVHLKTVVFLFGGILRDFKDPLLSPNVLPLGFDLVEIVVFTHSDPISYASKINEQNIEVCPGIVKLETTLAKPFLLFFRSVRIEFDHAVLLYTGLQANV